MLGLGVVWLSSSALVCWLLTRRVGPAQETAPTGWEELSLTTTDGMKLGAWYWEGHDTRPVVVLIHGVRDSRTGQLPLLLRLQAENYGVLAFSLRGHGDSEGSAGDYLGTRLDLMAAVKHLESKAPERKLLVLGRSLGSGAALFASKELEGRVSGYFLEAPFLDLKTAIWNRVDNYLPPGFDALAYLGLRVCSGAFLHDPLERISPFEHAPNVPKDCPVVVVAGGQDRRARPEEARAIVSQLGDVRLLVVEGAGHLQAVDLAPGDYWEAFDELAERVTTS